MTTTDPSQHPRWIQFFFYLDLLGFFLFLLGIQPGIFGLGRSHVMGYIKITVFLAGLGLVDISSYAVEHLMHPSNRALSIREDIGARLMGTGFVLAVCSSAADLIGLGSHPLPGPPYFGILQSVGLLTGVLIILMGLILYYPYGYKMKSRPAEDKTIKASAG
jgi:hypothetical protein